MTESEWLECADPKPMLEFLRGKARDRKFRLFACGCSAAVWQLIADDRNQQAVELAKRLADGEKPQMDIDAARTSIKVKDSTAWCALINSAWWAAFQAAMSAANAVARSAIQGKTWRGREERDTAWQQARSAARLALAGILRDIFGNLYRPVKQDDHLLQWTTWNGATVRNLAQTVYNESLIPVGILAPDRLAVLADALEDAGCDNQEILGHLRGPGPHVRGCFAVDLLLGME